MSDAVGGLRGWVLRCPQMGPLVFLVAALVVFPTLGRSGLKDWDEAIYASVSRQIFLTGDLVRLTLNGEPYFNKPPLFLGFTALSYAVFGVNEVSARFVSGVFGVLDVLLAYVLVARLFGKVTGVLTALFLLSSVRFLSIIQHGRMESMTAFFITLAVYSLARLGEGPRWTYAVFVSSGLGVLTKGAMGLMPFAIAAAYLALHRPARGALARRHVIGAAVAFLAIALPWFLLSTLANGSAFLAQFVGYEMGARLQAAVEERGSSPFFYLVDMAFSKLSAWGFLLPLSASFLLFRAFRARSAALVLMSVFLVVPYCLLTFGVGMKHSWYAFSLYAPAAFSAALLLEEARARAPYLERAVVAGAFLLVLSCNFTRTDKKLTIKELGPVVKAALADGGDLIAYRLPPQALHFYTERRVITVREPEGLRGHAGDCVVIWKKDLDDDIPGERIFENADYLVLRLGGQRP